MPNLRSLNLSQNELGTYGAKWIVKLLELIPSLMTVDLTLTRLPEMSQSLLADAAQQKGAKVIW